MLGYYKKHVLSLKGMINRLQENRDNLDLLREIQLRLIKRIILTERKIRTHKGRVTQLRSTLRKNRVSKEQALEVKKKRAFLEERIRQLQWLLYVWRAFGDALAFTYLDKWSVKPLLYNDKTPDVKQSSGFLDGKVGLPVEFSLVLDALTHRVPALLTDLTNSIRHGDVCLCGESVPYLLEVKSSSNLGARTERQASSLHNIQQYLQTDEGKDVRGAPYCKRVDIQTPEVNHLGLLNQLMEEAAQRGHAVGHPEPGLIYFVAGKDTRLPLEALRDISEPTIFFLNQAKTESTWMSYYPFTLAIQDPHHLYAFLRGELAVVVILDNAVVRRLAADRQLTFSVLENSDWGWEFEQRVATGEEPFRFRVSWHFISRVGLECLSLKWILDSNDDNYRWMQNNTALFEYLPAQLGAPADAKKRPG